MGTIRVFVGVLLGIRVFRGYYWVFWYSGGTVGYSGIQGVLLGIRLFKNASFWPRWLALSTTGTTYVCIKGARVTLDYSSVPYWWCH